MSGGIDVEDVQDFLIPMYSSPGSRDGNNTVITVIGSAKTLREVFRALSQFGLWDYLNYYLLRSIIAQFASDDSELNGMMEQYQKDLAGHILTLEIKEYLAATSYKHAIATSESENLDESLSTVQKTNLFNRLSVKYKIVTDHTLNYVNDLWRSLANQFALPTPAMILHNIAEGCVCITWLIPANLVAHITRMAQETSNMFAKQHILRVMLKDQCIYPMETLIEFPLPDSKEVTPKMKVCFLFMVKFNCWGHI